MALTSLVRNVPFWSRKLAHAGRRRSRTNNAGFPKSTAARSVAENLDAALTPAASNATSLVNVRTKTNHVNKHAAKRRKPVVTLAKSHATRLTRQEMKCNASKTSDGNCKKSLRCDDECARLERNRKLALALNIDPETHKDDHILYSSDTLSMYAENVKWSQTQEREFRVFASDDNERRLRFKPMTSHQRAFLHLLAEDFGLDSESMDPEPHRHVAVFKTPRFVSAPTKTLAECLRLRPQPTVTSEPAKNISISAAANSNPAEPHNALLLVTPRFGLTHADLSTALAPILHSVAGIRFDISFLSSGDEVVLKPRHANTLTTPLTDQDLLSTLRTLKPKLKRLTTEKTVAGDIILCRISPDSSLDTPKITRREGDGTDSGSGESGGGGGWSQVVAGAGVKKMVAPLGRGAVGGKSSFTVLGSRVREKERKAREVEEERARREESVVDDWEEEEVRREEEEAAKSRIERSGGEQAQNDGGGAKGAAGECNTAEEIRSW
ncbi:MAG: FKBP12-associated protein [Candelina mexicana]|nr:MAG: FKBP12-associated protein [Candelina mexicana]